MKALSLILMVAAFAILVASCSDDPTSPGEIKGDEPEPAPTKDQSVVFTLTKAVEHGDCDGWRCESTSTSGSDFKGDVYVQVGSQTKQKIWDVDWNDASGTKTLNKTLTLTVRKGEIVKLFSEGLKDADNWTSSDEGLPNFSKLISYPIGNYTDMTFDCIKGDPNGSEQCWCALTFYWTITPVFVD